MGIRIRTAYLTLGLVPEHGREFSPRGDAELPEHGAQVRLHGSRAENQIRGDLAAREAASGELRNASLGRRERLGAVARAAAHSASGLAQRVACWGRQAQPQ